MLPEFDSPESIREYYNLRDGIELHTKEGEAELLDTMRQKHPEINGRLDEAHGYVRDLYRQHVARNEMRDAVRGEVSEAQMEKQKSFFRRHPLLTTAAGIAALIALLYFTPTLAATAGKYGASLIESFKTVLANIGVATPGISVEAAAAVPVTGDVVSAEIGELAQQAFISPGEAMIQNAQIAEAIQAATGADSAVVGELSQAAEGLLESPAAAEALQRAAESLNVTDPLQRILQNLPPQ